MVVYYMNNQIDEKILEQNLDLYIKKRKKYNKKLDNELGAGIFDFIKSGFNNCIIIKSIFLFMFNS
jgi:hypothetical protein